MIESEQYLQIVIVLRPKAKPIMSSQIEWKCHIVFIWTVNFAEPIVRDISGKGAISSGKCTCKARVTFVLQKVSLSSKL